MNGTRKLWLSLSILLAVSFGVLLWAGGEIHRQAPPMPERVVQQPIIDLLVWMRVPGDVAFSVGALALAWFVLRLRIGPRTVRAEAPVGPATVRT